MSTSPGVLTAVRWNDLCPWLLLVRAARVALLVRVIALAVAGVFVTQWGWSAIESVLLNETEPARLARLTERPAPALWASADAPAPSRELFDEVDSCRFAGPLLRGWAWAIQPLTGLIRADGWRRIVALIAAGLWVMAVWALFGGAIARIAALYLTRGETLGPVAALKSAVGSWVSTLAAPSFCFGVIAIFVLLLMLVGLVMRLGFLAFLAALVWPTVLFMGVAVAIFAIGLLAGWPLMWTTIAAERTDSFDGVSRGYAFTFQRPLHFVFFLLVATALGLLAQAAVSLLVDGSLRATHWAIDRGLGDEDSKALFLGVATPPAESLGVLDRASAKLIRFWSAGLAALATAFPMAYLWPAAMGMYLLLRQQIDSTELGEVALDEGQPERGLPPLINDPATGVPTMRPAATPEPTTTVSELRGGST